MKVTLYCSPDSSSFQLSFHDWKENRGRMARIDLELVKALSVVEVTYDEVVVIEKTFMKSWTKQDKDNCINKAIKVLNGFMIEPEILK